MSTELEEALTAAGVSALIQKQIDPLLLEYQRRYAPLLRTLPSIKWGSTRYNFNQRTSRVPGGAVRDGGARPVGASVYAQSGFDVKNFQAVGAVTGFAQEVTRDLIGDLRAREIEGAVQSLLWDLETSVCWGNAASTNDGAYPNFDGLDTQASTFSGTGQNAVDTSSTVAAFSLAHLDQLIDLVESNASAPVEGSDWMFVTSSTVNSKLAQVLQNQQRFVQSGLGTVEVASGLIVPSYRNVPVVKSSFLNARSIAMTTVSSATATTGGTLAAGTYKYVVSAVIARMGETEASAEVSVTTTGSTSTVTLSFTPPTGFENGTALVYKVYRTSGSTGTETLLGYVDAVVGLSGDGVTPIVATSIVDTGTALVPQNSSTVPSTLPTSYYGTNTGHKPRVAGGEDIYLISRNRDNVIRPFVRDITPVDVYPTTSSPDSLPFALMSDTCLAVRAPKYMGRYRNVTASIAPSA